MTSGQAYRVQFSRSGGGCTRVAATTSPTSSCNPTGYADAVVEPAPQNDITSSCTNNQGGTISFTLPASPASCVFTAGKGEGGGCGSCVDGTISNAGKTISFTCGTGNRPPTTVRMVVEC